MANCEEICHTAEKGQRRFDFFKSEKSKLIKLEIVSLLVSGLLSCKRDII